MERNVTSFQPQSQVLPNSFVLPCEQVMNTIHVTLLITPSEAF